MKSVECDQTTFLHFTASADWAPILIICSPPPSTNPELNRSWGIMTISYHSRPTGENTSCDLLHYLRRVDRQEGKCADRFRSPQCPRRFPISTSDWPGACAGQARRTPH